MTSTGAASSPNVSSNNSSATKVVIPNKNVSESRGITPLSFAHTHIAYMYLLSSYMFQYYIITGRIIRHWPWYQQLSRQQTLPLFSQRTEINLRRSKE